MAKKPRLFYSPDRDESLKKEGGITILEEEWDDINQTELLEVIRINNHDEESGRTTALVHRGMPVGTLIKLYRKPKRMQELGQPNPVNRYRDAIMAFFAEHWDRIQDQIEVDCPGDCYQHGDLQVLSCFLSNKGLLNRYLSD